LDIDPGPISTSGADDVFSGCGHRADLSVTTRRSSFHHPGSDHLPKPSLAFFLQPYFREVANLLYAAHLVFPLFVGWNVTVGADCSQF
jgi:hypothetical protein